MILADDTQRRVCIDNNWSAFTKAFRYPNCNDTILSAANTNITVVRMWNFGKSTPFEDWRRLFASQNQSIIASEGNSEHYLRRPSLFSFQPTPALQALLPQSFPNCVVHLRHPDNSRDYRRGVDPATLKVISQTLSKDCFLITNHQEWYQSLNFTQSYYYNNNDTTISRPHQMATSEDLTLWRDWYTIYKAKRVYHTESGFSESAVHASGAEAYKILGVHDSSNDTLILEADYRLGMPVPTKWP